MVDFRAGQPVSPAADSTANVTTADAVGTKTDAAVTAVGTTKSIMAYAKGLITMLTVQTADSTNNAFAGDVTGNKTDATQQTVGTTRSLMGYVKGLMNALIGSGAATYPSAAAPANSVSLGAVLREIFDQSEKAVVKAAATLVNGTTIFTIAGGSIQIMELFAYCITANDGTASTLQFSSTPTLGSAKTISGASASLASAAAGAIVTLNPTALTTAPDLTTAANGGVALGANLGNRIIVNAGTMTIVVGVGSTTGTWEIHMRYKPLARGVTVT